MHSLLQAIAPYTLRVPYMRQVRIRRQFTVLCFVFLLPFHYLAVDGFSMADVFSSFVSPSSVNTNTRQTAKSAGSGEFMRQAILSADFTTQYTTGVRRRC